MKSANNWIDAKQKGMKMISRQAKWIFLIASTVVTVHAASQPNIILLFADDLGARDLGCFGSSYYETPNLDRLCSQGMKFSNAYSAAANCAPSRASLITGQVVPRHGVYTVGSCRRFDRGVVGWGGKIMQGPDRDDRVLLAPECSKGIGSERETIGTALQKAGYKTGYFGKWHTGWGGPIPLDAYEDELRGFDQMILNGPSHWKPEIWPDTARPIGEEYLSDYLADHAVQFIRENQGQPFFLFYADFLVHLPEQAPEPLIEKYKNKPPVDGQKNPTYAAMVESLDKSMGRILDVLNEQGLTENTLVFFTSDNGGDNRTCNLPLKGSKGMLTEGGIRVPAMVRWPGRVQPGSVCKEPVCGIDLFPTFAAVSGSSVNKENYLLDGENLTPLFENKPFPERALFWYMPGYLPGRQAPAAVIRKGDFKLIHFFEDNHLELYNLKKDVGETQNLAAALPEVAQDMKVRLDAWRKQTGAVIPVRNPDPKVGIMKIGGGWGSVPTAE